MSFPPLPDDPGLGRPVSDDEWNALGRGKASPPSRRGVSSRPVRIPRAVQRPGVRDAGFVEPGRYAVRGRLIITKRADGDWLVEDVDVRGYAHPVANAGSFADATAWRPS